MNICKCLGLVLTAVLLLPNSAASADAAKEAREKGKPGLEKKDYDAAITALTEAIRLGPTNAQAFYTRGNVYVRAGAFDKALADFTEAIRLDPKNSNAYWKRGRLHYRQGDLDKALADFSETIRLDRMFPQAYCNRGEAWLTKRRARTLARSMTSRKP